MVNEKYLVYHAISQVKIFYQQYTKAEKERQEREERGNGKDRMTYIATERHEASEKKRLRERRQWQIKVKRNQKSRERKVLR